MVIATGPLVMPSDIAGLESLSGYIKRDNRVMPVKFAYVAKRILQPGFVKRKLTIPESRAVSPVVVPELPAAAIPTSKKIAAPAIEVWPHDVRLLPQTTAAGPVILPASEFPMLPEAAPPETPKPQPEPRRTAFKKNEGTTREWKTRGLSGQSYVPIYEWSYDKLVSKSQRQRAQMSHQKYIALLSTLFFPTVALCQMRREVPPPPSPPETLNPDIAVTAPDPAFPLRVHLFDVRWGGLGYRNHGYGTGNLLTSASVQGFDFAFECDAPFQPNADPAESYHARWKKSPNQLEILTAEVGGRNTHICKLNLALEPRPFTEINSVRFVHGVSASFRKPWTDPGFAYEGPAPDYSLHFHVVDGQRQEDASGNHGTGTANLTTPEPGPTVQGADYIFDCERGFITNSQLDSYYPARWKHPGQTLELLMQRPGSNTVDHCIVTVALRPDALPQAPVKAHNP